MSDKTIKVALLLGGNSPEREVSKSTGKSILEALRKLNYDVRIIDPAYGLKQPDDEERYFSEEDYTERSNRNYIDAINSPMFEGIDTAFLALHGRFGEDGIIQSLLEMRGIKYTGSKILTSALAMDKEATKVMLLHYGVPTPKWIFVQEDEIDFDEIKKQIINEVGYPCVVKPNDQGSTVGLTICKEESEVAVAVNLALEFSDKALIEEFIEGHELTVGIIEDTALPALEIKPKHGLYDYECKYTSGMSEYIVPAQIPQNVFENLQAQALLAFQSLGCEGYSRIDFRVNSKWEIYCLEVNTLPGMTSTSLVPKMAKAVGISFDQLIDRIVKLSL